MQPGGWMWAKKRIDALWVEKWKQGTPTSSDVCYEYQEATELSVLRQLALGAPVEMVFSDTFE
jgi:hypothetical protein